MINHALIILSSCEFLIIVFFAILCFRKRHAVIDDLYNMFKGNDLGFSAKKTLAFATFFLIVHLHYRVVDQMVLLRLAVVDMLFILVLFGIIFFKDIITLVRSVKGDKDSNEENKNQNDTKK